MSSCDIGFTDRDLTNTAKMTSVSENTGFQCKEPNTAH